MRSVRLLIVGGGGRGTGYAGYTTRDDKTATVVGVAEPREFYRQRLADRHNIPPENVFADWRDAARRERFADAVVIATPDALHVEPAEAFAAKGYHMLLEKPMAPTLDGCRRVVRAVKDSGIIFAVCHVMRYTPYTRQVKSLLDAGAVGEVVSLQHLERVAYWHQAHSFVRGNWRNEAESSFMLLAKSCHDLDWIRYMMGVPCTRVASFGSLKHFRREEAPAGAAARCLDCGIEAACPYSAKKIYLGRVRNGDVGWPVNVLTPDVTEEGVLDALRTGPYGRCVYHCDNDVVDHQVVSMEFEGRRSASFTMTAFTGTGGRTTSIFGTHGEIQGDGRMIRVLDYLTDEVQTLDTEQSEDSIRGGHGGGDPRLMHEFIAAVAAGDGSRLLSGADETLESHAIVFAAEHARRQAAVVSVQDAMPAGDR